MPTALDIITDALELLGVYSPGDAISAADIERCFTVLTAMIDQWSAQNIFVQQGTPVTFSVLSGAPQYTIGESGSPTVAMVRPASVQYGPSQASIVISGQATNVDVISAIEYQALIGSVPPSSTPNALWYNPTYPNGTINLLPTPNANGTLTCYALSRLVQFVNLTVQYILSVGVYQTVRDNLAVSLKPYFTSAEIDPIIAMKAPVDMQFLRYQSQNSRALFNRYRLATNPTKAT